MSIRHHLLVAPLEDRTAPAAGGPDPTFGTAGIVRGQDLLGPTAVTPDGHLYVGVTIGGVGRSTVSLDRLNPDGSPDTAFGTNGRLRLPDTFSPANGAQGSRIVALPDGGGLLAWVNDANGQFLVARVTPAGTFDAGFGTGGQVVLQPPAPQLLSEVASLAVTPDGRIVVVGNEHPTRLTPGPLRGQVVVYRLNADGTSDTGFGQGGSTVLKHPDGATDDWQAGEAAVQSDGRIVLGGVAVGGGGAAGAVAVRLTASGQPDATFDGDGRVAIALPVIPPPKNSFQANVFQAVRVLPDGRVVLVGVGTVGDQRSAVAVRLTPAGQLDATYGTGGIATSPPLPTDTASGYDIVAAVDDTGRAVYATTQFSRSSSGRLGRFTPDGALDTRFGTNGQVDLFNLPGLQPGQNNLLALTIQPDSNVVLAGFAPPAYLARLVGSNPPAGFVPAARGTAVVGGPADGTVQVLSPGNGTYANAGTVTAFPGLAVNVRATTADVTGDGTPDYVTGAGPGGRPAVTVYDGKSGNLVADFLAFEPTFAGGVFVAAADLDGDGRAEVVVTPDRGGGPRVVVFSVAPGGAAAPRASFLGIDDPGFRGGARAALGDINKDGTPDLAVSAGFLGGPRTALFNGTTLLGGTPARLVADFFAFPGADATTLRNGVFVAAGDLDGDGFAELVFGGGPGGAPRVFALPGKLVAGNDVAGAQARPVSNFFVAGNTADRGGVRVAVADADADGKADLVAGSGAGSPARVRVYLGKNVTSSAEPGTVQDLAPFNGAALADGVYVG